MFRFSEYEIDRLLQKIEAGKEHHIKFDSTKPCLCELITQYKTSLESIIKTEQSFSKEKYDVERLAQKLLWQIQVDEAISIHEWETKIIFGNIPLRLKVILDSFEKTNEDDDNYENSFINKILYHNDPRLM